jgi:hypothetical protein
VYLVDTNVISELRKTKPHGAVSAWFATVRKDAVKIPASVIGEIQAGIELTCNQNPAKAAEIELWLERVINFYEVIPMDATIFRIWARLMHTRSDDLAIDTMIAATALDQNLSIVTRDIKHFKSFGITLINPFTHPRKP